MRGIIQTIHGDASSFVLSDYLEMPSPGPRDILIRISHSAVNRPYYVLGKDGSPLPPGACQVLGLEAVGHIVAVGQDCTLGFQEEEVVCALLENGGGYAEFCKADERQVVRASTFAPQELSLPQLAAIPLSFMTAYHLCFLLGQVKAGDSVLLHAAASSIGQAALQMLVRKGVTVFATVRSHLKRSRCSELGAKYTFVVSNPNPKFAEAVRLANRGKPVDLVLDPVGSAYLSENIEVLGMGGRLVLYGILGGSAVVDSSFLGKMLGKRITMVGDMLRSRSIEYRAEGSQPSPREILG